MYSKYWYWMISYFKYIKWMTCSQQMQNYSLFASKNVLYNVDGTVYCVIWNAFIDIMDRECWKHFTSVSSLFWNHEAPIHSLSVPAIVILACFDVNINLPLPPLSPIRPLIHVSHCILCVALSFNINSAHLIWFQLYGCRCHCCCYCRFNSIGIWPDLACYWQWRWHWTKNGHIQCEDDWDRTGIDAFDRVTFVNRKPK